jgi:hypothetical protein
MAKWIKENAQIVDLDGIEKDFASEIFATKQQEI